MSILSERDEFSPRWWRRTKPISAAHPLTHSLHSLTADWKTEEQKTEKSKNRKIENDCGKTIIDNWKTEKPTKRTIHSIHSATHKDYKIIALYHWLLHYYWAIFGFSTFQFWSFPKCCGQIRGTVPFRWFVLSLYCTSEVTTTPNF